MTTTPEIRDAADLSGMHRRLLVRFGVFRVRPGIRAILAKTATPVKTP